MTRHVRRRPVRTSRTKAGSARLLAALASVSLLSAGLVACSNGGDNPNTPTPGDTTSDAPTDPGPGAEAWEGVDDGTELSMWTRAPLEAQAKALVEAYNASHQNQVKLEIFPNDDMEGKVGAAAQ